MNKQEINIAILFMEAMKKEFDENGSERAKDNSLNAEYVIAVLKDCEKYNG